MAGRGAPEGNQNAKRGTMFRDAIRWALEHYEDEDPFSKAIDGPVTALRKMVMAQVKKAADDGNLPSFSELADRTDGKAVQAIAGVDDEGKIVKEITVKFLRDRDQSA